MLSNASLFLKHSWPLLQSSSLINIQAASFAVARSTPEYLSKAVSIASKRIKEKPEKSLGKQQKTKAPRGVSAYNLFLQEEVIRLRSMDKTVPTKDLFKSVSKTWNSLSAVQKEPYMEKAGARNMEVNKLKAAIKADARPINAYAKFVQEIIPSLRSSHPGVGAAEIMKRAAEAWKLVTPGEKTRRQEQYLANLSQWRAGREESAVQGQS